MKLGTFLGILWLAYCLIGGIVAEADLRRMRMEEPELSEPELWFEALITGALWPREARRVHTGKGPRSDD